MCVSPQGAAFAVILLPEQSHNTALYILQER